jgi:hypothetical protein
VTVASVHRKRRNRKHLEPLEWPSWTDAECWEIGPDPDDAGPYEEPSEADRRWLAEHRLEDDDRLFPDDDAMEQAALESQVLDRLERGLCD